MNTSTLVRSMERIRSNSRHDLKRGFSAAAEWIFLSLALAFSLAACNGGGNDSGGETSPPLGGAQLGRPAPAFDFASQYDYGGPAKVAINANGLAVEVHMPASVLNPLQYRIGQVNRTGDLTWQPGGSYDSGSAPDVAVNAAGTVVEVHSGLFSDLWYHVGTAVNGNSISWGGSIKYDQGWDPAVAINDAGLVVQAHHAVFGDTLYYTVGRVNASATGIDWGASTQYDQGAKPDVAVNNSGTVVEVHQASSSSDQLWYYVGYVFGTTIAWGPPVQYATGFNPTVDITDDGIVVEAHESIGILYYRTGRVNADGKSISWHASGDFGSGWNVSVASKGNHAIQVHASGGGAGMGPDLSFANSLLIDRSRWMQTTQGISRQPLWKTVLPGTHDSGAYNFYNFAGLLCDLDVSLCRVPASCRETPDHIPYGVVTSFATAQSKSLVEQLNGGIRYFDIRPVFQSNQVRTYHDAIAGWLLSEELEKIDAYFASAGPELVILSIGGFCSFDDSAHESFVNLINDKIGRWLYKGPTDGLLTKTVGELMTPNGNVIVGYADDYILSHPKPGFLRSLPINGSYADTTDIHAMWADQRTKLRTVSTPSSLFMLNWTLTFRGDHWANDVLYLSLHNISKPASANLSGFINETYGGIPNTNYQMNILSVDYFEEAKVVDYAVWLNGLYNGR